MKVVENSQSRLVIEDRPWFLWIVLSVIGGSALIGALTGQVDGWGTTALVAGLGAGTFWVLWRFAPFQRFVFDRTEAAFTHQVHRVTGSQNWTRSLNEIRRAAGEGNWSDGTRLERITLLTTDGRHPLESGYSSASKTPIILAINERLGVADQ